MVKLKFKALLLLHPGENTIKFDFLGVKDNLRIFYRELKREYFVRSVSQKSKNNFTLKCRKSL